MMVPRDTVPSGAPHAMPVDAVLEAQQVDAAVGLAPEEAARRLAHYGANALRAVHTRSALSIFVDQFKSIIMALLAAATGVSLLIGDLVEAAAIGVVIVINAALGFGTELRAVRSMDALRRIGTVTARVRRGGRIMDIEARALVPGDIIIVDAGMVAAADMRLVEAAAIEADESLLTGESVPVAKSTDAVDEAATLSDRRSMIFKGTAVTRGAGTAVVAGTGMNTELGRISALVEEAAVQKTPLERRLARLGGQLVWVTLVVAAAIVVLGIINARDSALMIQTGIALAVAAIPQGLPVVATLALARGMWRMARRNVLIESLPAVETLGATTLICTDKTGTLTENRMTVTALTDAAGAVTLTTDGFQRNGQTIDPGGDPLIARALEIAVLCNDAYLPNDGDTADAVGDPLEIALLAAGAKAGLRAETILRDRPRIGKAPFDPETRLMASIHGAAPPFRVFVKGAPEAVIAAACDQRSTDGVAAMTDQLREDWHAKNEAMAASGLRVLALAEGQLEKSDADPFSNLRLVGLIGLEDPPREDVRAAIGACQRAGMRIVMVTGDQPNTAQSVARAVGLVNTSDAEVVAGAAVPPFDTMTDADRDRYAQVPIYARVDPKQKLELVSLYQSTGEVVAMTGDGVNDAPALKKADIGIAMGRRGTQVAREVSDMVLRDDSFASIVTAIEQGRVIFSNIRKFVMYLLSCNLSEVLVVALATISGSPLPLLPLQILYLNIVTDVFPAFALGAGEGERGVMRRPPRDPRESLLERPQWLWIIGNGLAITAATLGAFWIATSWLVLDYPHAVTVSFMTLALAQIWHVFDMRHPGSHWIFNEVVRNRYVWAAVGFSVFLVGAAVFLPGLSTVLGLPMPPLPAVALAVGFSLLPVLVGQIALAVSNDAEVVQPRV